MIPSVDIDLALYEASRAEAEKVIKQFETNDSRKTLIEAGNEGIINALRRHFSQREKGPEVDRFSLVRATLSKALLLARDTGQFRRRKDPRHALFPGPS